MRLLVVSQHFWPENFRINDLVAEFAARGHDVTVLTGYPNYPEGKLFPNFRADPRRFDTYEGARVVRVPVIVRGRGGLRLAFNYLSFAASASLLGAWRLRGRAFDSILVFAPSPITVGIPAAVMRFLKKAPSAIWILDLWPETLKAVGVVRSKFLLDCVGLMVSWIYRHCDLILAQSHSFISSIKKYSGARPVVYFPNWAETMFSTQAPVAAEEVPPAPDRFNIMFAGNIGDAQDFPTILAAAQLLKRRQSRVRWLIVGDGRRAEWTRSEIQRLGLEDTVLMLGRHPVERMPAFYRHADVLFLALKDELIFAKTIPGKLQSYLAAGLPVLAMLNGEGADVVSRSGAGVASPAGDATELANAAEWMASRSPAQRAEMGRCALAISNQEFDRDKQLSRLEDWLGRLSFAD